MGRMANFVLKNWVAKGVASDVNDFNMEELTRLEIIHLVDVSLRELEFQLSKGRRSLVAAEKKSYFRTLTGLFLYWVSLLLNVIKGHLKVHENASLMLLCYHTELFLQIRFTGK